MQALSREQIRSIDQYAIEQLGIPGVILMENAGRSAADAIESFLGGSAAGRRIGIVAGKGNNGGDGFVVARHLAIRGFRCQVFLTAEADDLAGDARTNYNAADSMQIPIHEVTGPAVADLSDSLADFELLVDAVGGTGIQGALRGSMAEVVIQINQTGKPVVAIDIPTGLDADSGKAEGPVVRAELTVTFAAWKTGFDQPGAEQYTGRIELVDIGIDAELAYEMSRGS